VCHGMSITREELEMLHRTLGFHIHSLQGSLLCRHGHNAILSDIYTPAAVKPVRVRRIAIPSSPVFTPPQQSRAHTSCSSRPHKMTYITSPKDAAQLFFRDYAPATAPQPFKAGEAACKSPHQITSVFIHGWPMSSPIYDRLMLPLCETYLPCPLHWHRPPWLWEK